MDWIVSLTPTACTDPLDALRQPPEGASAVELRADLFPGLDLRCAVIASPLPLLVTARSTAEGGQGPNDPEKRRMLLRAARDSGAALIDLEVERDAHLMDEIGLDPERVVLSWHDVTATPADLDPRCRAMLARPARWIKVVPTARSLADLERVVALHRRFNQGARSRRRLITFAMGLEGVASRYLAPLLGPPISFAAWSGNAPAAPGQLPVERLEAVVGHLAGPPQRLYGVIGADTSHSLSPVMHAAGYRELGLPYAFLPLSISCPEELDELFVPQEQGLFSRLGLTPWGWAVTAPYKELAARAATMAAPRVQRAGAANTLILRSTRVLAENTDADGVVGALRSLGIDPAGLKAVVAGTGGAARGTAVGLHLAGATVILRGRSAQRTRQWAQKIAVDWCPPGQWPDDAAILVNATPLGSGADDPNPFSTDQIARAQAIVDLVYANQPTALARAAAELERPFADGREFLAQQGYAQFAAFTGILPPKETMRAALSGG